MEPALHRVTICREGSAKNRSMLGETAPCRTAIRNHDPDANGDRRPSSFPGKVAGQPPIAINLSHQAAEVANRTLHLDDQHGAPPGMPRHDVDRATLAADRKRYLGVDDPDWQVRQAPDERLAHPRVTSIDQPVQVTAVPARNKFKSRIESGKHSP